MNNCEGFLVNCLWSPFEANKSRKLLETFGGKSENSEENSRQKSETFEELSFCKFSDLKNQI